MKLTCALKIFDVVQNLYAYGKIQGEIFSMRCLSWHGALVFKVTPEGLHDIQF